MRGKPEAVSAKLQDAWVILEAKYNETQRCLKTGAANIAGHEGDNPWDPRTDGTVQPNIDHVTIAINIVHMAHEMRDYNMRGNKRKQNDKL